MKLGKIPLTRKIAIAANVDDATIASANDYLHYKLSSGLKGLLPESTELRKREAAIKLSDADNVSDCFTPSVEFIHDGLTISKN